MKSADTATLYVNGERVGSAADDTESGQALQRITLGVLKDDNLIRYLPGAIDDVHLCSRVVSHAEIGGLASRTEPFSESFDLNADGAVAFKDLAALADARLEALLWPQP